MSFCSNDILSAHTTSQIEEYSFWKEKIRTCSYTGTKKLVNNLEQAEASSDGIAFLNFLVEFNFAVNFLRHDTYFVYEPTGYDDFLLEDTLSISIKSLQQKAYTIKEDEQIQTLRKKSEENRKPYSAHLDYNHSFVELVVDGSEYERMEIARPGQPFASERREKSKVLSLIADEQEKLIEKSKVLFLFVQNQGFNAMDFSDITNWYFAGRVRKFDWCKQYYARDFKTQNKTILEKNDSVKAIVYFHRPSQVLIWPENIFAQPERCIVAGKDKRLNKYIKKLFLDVSLK